MGKQKNLGITVSKEDNFSEWYTQVVQKAELVDIRFGIQGFIVHMPWGFYVLRKIYQYLEEEVEKQGHMPYHFPLPVKEINLKKEKEHAGFTPEVFWVSEAGDKKLDERFALRPTGEAQIYPLYSLWFRSHKDLPFKGYQSRISSYRNEMTTRPYLRGREFLFFETHDVFNTHEENMKQINLDIDTCNNVINKRIKIPYLYFRRPKWDKFKGSLNTYTADTIMPDGKRNQMASTHDLGQNFSKVFDIKIAGEDKSEYHVWQTCFGPGIVRIMAAIVGIHGDNKGLVLPFDMAAVQIVIVPVLFSKNKSENNKVIKEGKKIESELEKLDYRVKLDLDNETPGFKFNKWELKGVPVRIEIGPNELKNKSATISLRTSDKKKLIKLSQLKVSMKKFESKIDSDLKKNAELYFKNKTRSVNTFKDLKMVIERYRGFIKAPFCSVEMDGERCADKLKESTEGGHVCGTLYPQEEKVNNKKCIMCGKKAKHLVYIAKSY